MSRNHLRDPCAACDSTGLVKREPNQTVDGLIFEGAVASAFPALCPVCGGTGRVVGQLPAQE